MNSRDDVLREWSVSRETAARLDILVNELHRWQPIKNLVGPATLTQVWPRHIADSLQLLAHAPDATRWLDLGSGAGFPGLVLAIVLAERAEASVDLVESNSRKCAFLRQVSRLAGTPTRIHQARIEDTIDGFSNRVDVVTARALAPLTQLLEWTSPLLKTGTVGLFPKGRDLDAELTEARKSWTFEAEIFPSRTDSEGRIVRITALSRPQNP